jgi:hypothetical protein
LANPGGKREREREGGGVPTTYEQARPATTASNQRSRLSGGESTSAHLLQKDAILRPEAKSWQGKGVEYMKVGLNVLDPKGTARAGRGRCGNALTSSRLQGGALRESDSQHLLQCRPIHQGVTL